MGTCCGYLRMPTNVTVTDPTLLEAIKQKCDVEVKASRSHPSENPQAELSKLNSNNNSSSQENIEKHGTCGNKEDTNHRDDIIVVKKPEGQLRLEINTVSQPPEEDSSKRKSANLKPLAGPEHRRDSRSTTSINNLIKSKKLEESEKKIEVNELKLSARLIERVQKLQASGRRRKKRETTRIFLRSMSMGGDCLSELAEMEEKDEKDDEKTKEEIAKELKENKEIIEQNQKKMTFIQQTEEVKSSGDHKKKKNVNVNFKKKKAAEEPVPGKSLLKKYRTIDDKKKKKKRVKFQDLVDKKKKKKAQNKY